MTAPTPEQMRALAVHLESNADAHQEAPGTERRRAAAALRTAADQLEAVQELHQWLRKNIGSPDLHARLDEFTAETAPQEGRDE